MSEDASEERRLIVEMLKRMLAGSDEQNRQAEESGDRALSLVHSSTAAALSVAIYRIEHGEHRASLMPDDYARGGAPTS